MSENDWTSNNPTQSQPGDSLSGKAQEAKDKVSGMVRGAINTMDAGRSGAARGLDAVASGLQEHADVLPGGKSVREFASAAADQVTQTADYVRGTDLRAMMSDVEGVVKKNPGPALLMAVGLGFIVGRALRS